MQSNIFAKAVVFDRGGKVLLLRRSETDTRRPGEQDFPGGGIEVGEDLRAGMSREIAEETSLRVDAQDLHLVYAASEAHSDRSVTRLLFWTKIESPEVVLSYEHDAYQWVTPEEALRFFPHPFYGVGLAYGLKHELFAA